MMSCPYGCGSATMWAIFMRFGLFWRGWGDCEGWLGDGDRISLLDKLKIFVYNRDVKRIGKKNIDVLQINIIDRDMESFRAIGKRGMMMVTKPDISPAFTMEDIHKIREYHYELTKDMTIQERLDFYNEGAKVVLKEMEERRVQRSQKE